MQKKTYSDKQREAQQARKQEELWARAAKNSAAPNSQESGAETKTVPTVKKTSKSGKQARRPS